MTTVALTWHSEQSVSREEVIAAAQSFLQHMGWQNYQALLLAHTDPDQQRILLEGPKPGRPVDA